MPNKLKHIVSAAVLVLGAAIAQAQEATVPAITLHVGDPAPAITVSKFIKGQPVASFEKGKSYIVEFWATWCGPCKVSIPHLTQLQKQYKDIIFIGQDCSETDLSLVEPFVKEMGDQMDYRVAMDDVSDGSRGKMHANWLRAAGETGIPTAFLVDGESRIVWIGHPMLLDKVLPAYVAGTFDWKAEKVKSEAIKAVKLPLRQALSTKDYDKAITLIEDFNKANPSLEGQFGMTLLQLKLAKKDFSGATAYATQLAESQKDDADTQNGIAWLLVAPNSTFPKPDLDLALKCATRAAELSKNSPSVVDTLAHVYAAKGDFDKAIALETDAVARADADQKAELQANLDRFKTKKK